jgi:RNA polymerase sigma-70 factor (ECF subfamily)
MAGVVAVTTSSAGRAVSDAELVQRVLAGDRALFEELMRRHNQRVYRTIRGILGSEEDVEDTMQQAYLLAYAHLGGFAGASSFSTWLTGIAVHEAYSYLRKRRRISVMDEVPDVAEDFLRPPSETPEHRATAQQSMRLIEAAVDRLPLPYRTTFMLREVEQLSTIETSETLGITPEAVKTRLHRARRVLRDTLSAAVGQSAPQAFAFLAPRCRRVAAAVMGAIELAERQASTLTSHAEDSAVVLRGEIERALAGQMLDSHP